MTQQISTRTVDGVQIPAPGTFALDPNHTVVGAVARHLMVSKVRGSFGTVAGVITIAEQPTESSVSVTIDAASFDTGNVDRDNHLRAADFLDVATHPTITFQSTRVAKQDGARFSLAGDLTIRGVTREVELDVEFEGVAKSPWGQEVIGFSASTELDREEFGITWNQALETGGVLVGKKVKVEISAECVRQA
jgi:polyisoprenoid-binding protein YceI